MLQQAILITYCQSFLLYFHLQKEAGETSAITVKEIYAALISYVKIVQHTSY